MLQKVVVYELCMRAFVLKFLLVEANEARQALSDAEHSLKLTREEEQTAHDDLSDLFDPDGFGPEGEWKKLNRLCLEKDTGEFVISHAQTLRY